MHLASSLASDVYPESAFDYDQAQSHPIISFYQTSQLQHIWHGPWFPRWCSRYYTISNQQQMCCNVNEKASSLAKDSWILQRTESEGCYYFFFLQNLKHDSFNIMSVWKRNSPHSIMAWENIKLISTEVDKPVDKQCTGV